MNEHRGLDHKGVMRDCIQEWHFCGARDGVTFEAGDVVLHRPTGETWVVVRCEGGYVYPAGWPSSRALVSDCELKQ